MIYDLQQITIYGARGVNAYNMQWFWNNRQIFKLTMLDPYYFKYNYYYFEGLGLNLWLNQQFLKIISHNSWHQRRKLADRLKSVTTKKKCYKFQ